MQIEFNGNNTNQSNSYKYNYDWYKVGFQNFLEFSKYIIKL